MENCRSTSPRKVSRRLRVVVVKSAWRTRIAISAMLALDLVGQLLVALAAPLAAPQAPPQLPRLVVELVDGLEDLQSFLDPLFGLLVEVAVVRPAAARACRGARAAPARWCAGRAREGPAPGTGR